jgi:ribosomal-protein-alanine N-acetyltransferase
MRFKAHGHTIRDAFCLETDRLLLRVIRPNDADRVVSYLNKNRSFHAPFHQIMEDEYFTIRGQRIYMRSDFHKFLDDMQFPFWISEKSNPDVIIGRLSFSHIIRGALQSSLVGYHLDQDMIGRGYMREALSAGCNYMFKVQKLHRIQADIMPSNTRSKNTVLACGFRLQGMNKGYMCIAGKWTDHEIYALLNDPEWAPPAHINP